MGAIKMNPTNIFYKTGENTYLQRKSPYYDYDEVKSYAELNDKKQVPITGNVFYFDSQFPRTIANNAGYTTVQNINDADIIVLPQKFVQNVDKFVSCYTDDNKPIISSSGIGTKPFVTYKKTNWLEYIDNPKTVSSRAFYRQCRKSLPVLDTEETEKVKELFQSADPEIRKTGALMIVNYNLPETSSRQYRDIIYSMAKSVLYRSRKHQYIATFCMYI